MIPSPYKIIQVGDRVELTFGEQVLIKKIARNKGIPLYLGKSLTHRGRFLFFVEENIKRVIE